MQSRVALIFSFSHSALTLSVNCLDGSNTTGTRCVLWTITKRNSNCNAMVDTRSWFPRYIIIRMFSAGGIDSFWLSNDTVPSRGGPL